MNNKSLPYFFALLLLLCAALVGINAAVVSADSAAVDGQAVAPKKIAYAESVAGYRAGSGSFGANWSDPLAALGKVDSKPIALGNAQTATTPPADPTDCEAVLILGFGKNRIIDGEGDDLTIYEMAGGPAEPTWIYVGGGSLGADSWRYVGKSSGGQDGLDIGHVAGAEDYFTYVAICDVPDGDTTVWPGPGPDIDAVSANSSFRLGMVAEAQSPGWGLNGDPLPELEDVAFEPEDVFTFSCPEGVPLDRCPALLIIKARCNGTFTYDYLYAWPADWFIVTFEELLFEYRAEKIDNLVGNCEESSIPATLTAQDPAGVYALQKGAMGFLVAEKAYRFELETPVASLYSAGIKHFSASHDPDAKKTTIWVLGGSLEVTPSASVLGPVTVKAGEQAVISDGGLETIDDLAQIYMPVVTHKGP